tara:strand:+ start:3182 stop:4498 length:1317 start_codon:yes stop_codon:yes gene_type:complete
MKKRNKILSMLILLLFTASCSDYTDGINESPNDFSDAPGDLLIGQANLAVIKLSGSQASRISGIWTDQFTGADRQYIPLNKYIVTAGDFDDDWVDLYVNGLSQAKLAESFAQENGNTILEGVSKIMQSILLGEAASLWGNVPNVEASDYAAFPNPNYDDQADVLNDVQILLDDAIDKLTGLNSVDVYDFGFQTEGNWVEIAHSLKARYFLVAKDYSAALSESQMGISEGNDLLSWHSDAQGSKNLYYQFVAEERGGYLEVNGPSFLYKLLNNDTPRLLTTPGDSNRKDKYFDGTSLNTNADGYFAIDASFPIISYVETKLIEAEAAQRVGGNTGNQGLAALNAVRSHLQSEYGGLFPASNSIGENLTKEILEEKYISLIGSLQVFHDARRTNNILGIPIKSPTATSLPQRFLYPQSEIGSNENFPGVIDLFTATPVNN